MLDVNEMRAIPFTILTVAALLLCLFPAQLTDAVNAQEAFDLYDYHSYGEVKEILERASSEYPDIARLESIGRTWEGRDILALRLTDRPDEDEPGEPAILIMGGHHGNELPSVEVPLYILNFLVENYGVNGTVRDLVDSRDIWFVPLVNPDGREYALGSDPTWRKNRRPIDADGDGTIDGTGVDINRNYGHLWGELPGTSHIPSAINYCGPGPFSENETQAIRNLAQSVNFSISLSYHTYGDVIYYPWNNGIETVSPEAGLLAAIAEDMGALTGYTPMNGIDAYPTTGDSDDWLYAETDCLPFTVELGTQYVVPLDQLEALCARNLDAALFAIDIVEEPERALLPDWTIMVYMSADADAGLASEALVDINEMEVAGSTQDVNVIVLYDGAGTGDSRIYRIQKDPGGFNTAIISPTVDDGGAVIPLTGEADMSDPATLRNFVSWANENHRAQRYFLIFWGHGDGVLLEFVPDKGSGMRVAELNPALAGFSIDIIGFDACSMGHFEVAAELVGIADIMIGSEAREPLAGWDYDASLTKLVQRPGMGPRELAKNIVSDYLDSRSEDYITLSALDLSAFRDRMVPALRDFVNASLDMAYPDHQTIWAARNFTDAFVAAQDAVDLFEFLDNLVTRNISAPVMDRANRILEMRDDLIIFSGTGTLHTEATTMAVYFPHLEVPISGAYSELRFTETGWRDYISGVKEPPARPVIHPVPPRIIGDTLGPYMISTTLNGTGAGPFTLFYRPANGTWQSKPMQLEGLSLTAEIPGYANGTVIEYYFLDEAANITEPYEVKWGGADYFTLSIMAVCDISLSWVELPPSPWQAGNATVFRLNCSNAGPETALVNVTLAINGTSGTRIIGWRELELGPGEYAIIQFNWTAVFGEWGVSAFIAASSAFDPSPENNVAGAWLNVTLSPGKGFMAEYGLLLLLIASMWGAAGFVMLLLLHRGRRRRHESLSKSINAARDFLNTAQEFGGDITEAGLLLAKAEAALAGGKHKECEGLVSRSRESAMNAVAQGGGKA